MKFKNEYIVCVIYLQRQYIICMTIIIAEESGAQEILNSINKMASNYISAIAKKQVTEQSFHYQFITMVKQTIITESEANDIKV